MKSLLSTFFIAVLFSLGQIANAAPPAKAFGELPLIHDGAISPAGDKLAVIVNVKGQYRVIAKDFGGGKSMGTPWSLSLGNEAKPRYIKWVNDDRFVISLNKPENYKGTPFSMGYLYAADTQTRKGEFLVLPRQRKFRQFNNVVVDWLEDEPEHILMAFSDEEFNSYPDIKKVNFITDKYSTVKAGQNGIENWITDRSGTPRIGFGRRDLGSKRLIIFNKTTEKWEDAKDYPGLTVDTRIFSFIGNGNEVVIGDYRGKNTLGLYVYDLGLKKITRKVFHNDDYDASSVLMSKDGETVIGAKYTADTSKTELLDGYNTVLSSLRRRFSDFDIDLVDQTENGKRLLLNMSSPYDPGAFLYFASGDTEPTILGSMYSGLSQDDMGQVVSVSYKARDGIKIPAFITIPKAYPTGKSIKNLPFIVLPHGGPYARDEKRFDYFAQFFASRGYGVLQMNFRGSEGYGKPFSDAGRNNWIVMQDDVTDGAKWLYEKGYANPDKTCIAGWSFGGYAALMGAAKHADLYSCVIAMAALTDINDAKRDMMKYRGGRVAAKEFFGEAMKDPAVRRANSPVNVADQITVPVFLAHGEDDQNVQFDQFTKMRKALKKSGVKAQYVTFKDEDHYLSRQENREKFFMEMDNFLHQVHGKNEFVTP